MKRRVSILKAQGKISGAISTLNKFLAPYQADMAAVHYIAVQSNFLIFDFTANLCYQWSEMAELQLSVSNYKNAAFCFEELILSDPMSYLLHCRLAEVKIRHHFVVTSIFGCIVSVYDRRER